MKYLMVGACSLTILLSVTAWGALSSSSAVDDILDALHERGQGLKDFSAEVKLTDTDPNLGDSSSRSGKVWFENQADGNARMHLVFETRESGQQVRKEKIEYSLEKGILIDRNYRQKKEVTRQVIRPGEKVNLLKLGEGPFPLPIGQDKTDVRRLFDVTKVEAAKDDPADTIHIKLLPKAKTQFERRFAAIDVWVDMKDAMPRRIQTTDKNEEAVRTTELSNVKINEGLKDADFVLEKINEDEWSRMNEAYQE